MATRPVQDMSYGLAAIKAAKEVQADTFAPELYRQANEWFFQAKKEYKVKNFKLAQEYSIKARRLAEQAEFEAIRSGGVRADQKEPLPPAASSELGSQPGTQKDAYSYPTPQGTPAEEFEQRKAAEDEARKRDEAKSAPAPTSPPPGAPPSVAPPPVAPTR